MRRPTGAGFYSPRRRARTCERSKWGHKKDRSRDEIKRTLLTRTAPAAKCAAEVLSQKKE